MENNYKIILMKNNYKTFFMKNNYETFFFNKNYKNNFLYQKLIFSFKIFYVIITNIKCILKYTFLQYIINYLKILKRQREIFYIFNSRTTSRVDLTSL